MDTTSLLALTLVFIRISSFFIVVKVFFPKGTPNTLKLVISMVFSFSMLASIDFSNIENINNTMILILYVLAEISTGAILGLITNVIFEVIIMAGSLIDINIGFGMVNMYDPNSQMNTSITGNLLHYIALSTFFIIDGHHMIIKSFLQGFALVPLGETIISNEKMMVLIEIITKFFAIGLKIAIPIVLIIILTDLCMGLVSRAVPQINVMILGMPVKVIIGVITVAVTLPLFIKIFVSSFSQLPEVYHKIFSLMPIALIFSDEKTEEATPKKKSDSRKKGQVARSKDVGLALTMIAALGVIMILSGFIGNSLREDTIYFLSQAGTMEVSQGNIEKINLIAISRMAKVILPAVLPIMLAGVAASLIQTGFMFSGESIKPSFGKLNPISGFKNIFSKKSAVELIKNLIIITIVMYLGYSYIRENYSKILQIGNLYLPTLGIEVKALFVGIFKNITILLVVLAAGDYFIQFRMHNDELKMTKQEIKEEYKQMEGDPQIKSKIKQKQREISQRRMMQSVGDATVVITNPTHLAVAIKYTEGEMEAPKVIAKGADIIAIKIKEKARDAEVPIIENKALARMIYEKVEIDQDIPQDMYQAVAEILATILKLKHSK